MTEEATESAKIARAEPDAKAERPSHPLDPRSEITKTFIKAVATVIVAGIGLLGPITTAVTKLYELKLDEKKFGQQIALETKKNKGAQQLQDATLKHQTEMDFLGRLIDTQELKAGEITRTIYRRDVLKFFEATLSAGGLHDLARAELGIAEGQLKVFDELREQKEAATNALESKKAELLGTKAADATQLRGLHERLAVAERRLREANWGSVLPPDGSGLSTNPPVAVVEATISALLPKFAAVCPGGRLEEGACALAWHDCITKYDSTTCFQALARVRAGTSHP